MLLNFRLHKISFSVNAISFVNEKHMQENLETKLKVFHERWDVILVLFHFSELFLHLVSSFENMWSTKTYN